MLGGALVGRGLGSGGFLVFALGGVLGAVTVFLVPVVAAARTRTDAGRAAGKEPGDAAGAGREPNSRVGPTSPGRTR